MDAGRIVRYGCPDRYGVGVNPVWCERLEDVTFEECKGCWEQVVEEE